MIKDDVKKMTKEEAEKKICPVMSGQYQRKCAADGCMMWQWDSYEKIFKGNEAVKDERKPGYFTSIPVFEYTPTAGHCVYKIT